MNLWKKLHEPFPDEEEFGKNVISIFWISVFVTAVIYFLEPFGTEHWRMRLLSISVGFGLITFCVSVLYLLFFSQVLKIKQNIPSWTLGRWFLYIFGLLTCITAGNFFFVLPLTTTSRTLTYTKTKFSTPSRSKITSPSTTSATTIRRKSFCAIH